MKRPQLRQKLANMPWAIVLAGLGIFFAADDQTSVVVLLPDMTQDLGLAQDQFFRAAWIINGYILSYVVIMPLMGHAADSLGHGRVYALALVLFCIGSAAVALGQDLTFLSLARGVQAIGAGAILPVSMALVTARTARSSWPLWLGALAATNEVGALLGPLWAGAVSNLFDWRAVFWLNLPLCLPIALLIWRYSASAADRSWRSIDYAGAALLGISLALLAFALTDDPIEPRSTGFTLLLLLAAGFAFLALLLRQTRARLPILDLPRFRALPLTASFAANALLGGTLIVAMVNVPLFTNTVLLDSALDGGLNLMRLTLGLAFGALAGGWLSTHRGRSLAAASGAVLAGLGYLGMSAWDTAPNHLELTLPLLIAGFGMGMLIAPLMAAVMAHVGPNDRATWASLVTVTRLLGALVGVALLTTQGLTGFYAEAAQIPLDQTDYAGALIDLQVQAYSDTFIAAAVICFVMALPAALLGRHSSKASEDRVA